MLISPLLVHTIWVDLNNLAKFDNLGQRRYLELMEEKLKLTIDLDFFFELTNWHWQ
jgi:hypothetical protein